MIDLRFMNKNLRISLSSFVVSLILIRFWIEIVTTTLLKDSQIINGINNNKIGFHHYQLGILIVFISLLLQQFLKKYKNFYLGLLGFGLALFVDQYTYVLSLIGINLPFGYRSQLDYLIIAAAILCLILFWSNLSKKTTEKE